MAMMATPIPNLTTSASSPPFFAEQPGVLHVAESRKLPVLDSRASCSAFFKEFFLQLEEQFHMVVPELAHENQGEDLNKKHDLVNKAPVATAPATETVADRAPKLAAVCEAIISLRKLCWAQVLDPKTADDDGNLPRSSPVQARSLTLCECGNDKCIEVCDIKKWLPTLKLDPNLWELISLLGKSYLALAEAYKNALKGDQLHQAFEVVNIACSFHCSMPQHLRNTLSASQTVFWFMAWTLVGDVHAKFYDGEILGHSTTLNQKPFSVELRVPYEDVYSDMVSRSKEASTNSSSAGKHLFTHGSRGRAKKSATRTTSAMTSASNTTVDHPQGSSSPSASTTFGNADDGSQTGGRGLTSDAGEVALLKEPETRGGIFKRLKLYTTADADDILLACLSCFKEAVSLSGTHVDSKDLQEVIRRIGWVHTELGMNRNRKKEFLEAEFEYVNAMKAFKEISDSTSIVKVYWAMAEGRLEMAAKVVSEIGQIDPSLCHAYKKALRTAQMNYARSLGFYQAAKSVIAAVGDGGVGISAEERNKADNEMAYTYFSLGTFLAKEYKVAEIYGYQDSEDTKNIKKELEEEFRDHVLSANDALLKALDLFESLGDSCKFEVAHVCFELGCHQGECCLKIIDPKIGLHKHETGPLDLPELLSESCWKEVTEPWLLAEKYWLKALEYFNADTDPVLCLMTLVQRSYLLLILSCYPHSDMMLESALNCLLDARMVSSQSETIQVFSPETYSMFWKVLQKVLLEVLLEIKCTGRRKSGSESNSQVISTSKRSLDAEKMRKLYEAMLRAPDFDKLDELHKLWTSES